MDNSAPILCSCLRRYMSLRLPLTTLAVTGLGLTIGADLMGEQHLPPEALANTSGP